MYVKMAKLQARPTGGKEDSPGMSPEPVEGRFPGKPETQINQRGLKGRGELPQSPQSPPSPPRPPDNSVGSVPSVVEKNRLSSSFHRDDTSPRPFRPRPWIDAFFPGSRPLLRPSGFGGSSSPGCHTDRPTGGPGAIRSPCEDTPNARKDSRSLSNKPDHPPAPHK